LIPNDTYILEAGFERMNGVDFRKGCYVGQEIVARMKHKTELRKQYVKVSVSGPVTPGAAILDEDAKPAGVVYSNRDGVGIALLRLDRARKATSLSSEEKDVKEI
jgi:folate-binding protein YgfZ